MYYLMKRPFDIGTFPKVEIKTFHNLNYKKSKFYCAIKTHNPLTDKEVYDYELKLITDQEFSQKNWFDIRK